MTIESEINRSISNQRLTIELKAFKAVNKLKWMYAVGSGLCGCGADMDRHPLWDNHAPTEIPVDKSRAEE